MEELDVEVGMLDELLLTAAVVFTFAFEIASETLPSENAMEDELSLGGDGCGVLNVKDGTFSFVKARGRVVAVLEGEGMVEDVFGKGAKTVVWIDGNLSCLIGLPAGVP